MTTITLLLRVLAAVALIAPIETSDMHASPKAYELIKASEGLCLSAYDCPAGVKTIGWGHTHGVKPGDVITQHQAETFLAADVAECERIIASAVKVPLTQDIFDALTSFVFSVGPGKKGVKDGFVTLKSGQPSTLLRKLNAGDYAGARRALLAWVHANGMVLNGLVKRRDAEWKLWGDEAPQAGADLNAQGSSTTATGDDAVH